MIPNPRILIRLAFAAATLTPAANAQGQRVDNATLSLPTAFSDGDYTSEPFINATAVLAIAKPPGTTHTLYLAEREGRIQAVTNLDDPAFESDPFLDISSRVTTNSENGLLGLAFHPKYQTNGYVYVFYTTQESGQSTNRLSRFNRSAENPLQADPASERILFDQVDQANNHNGGDIHFGPDGYLYVAVGDEGGGNDSYNNGQFVDKDLFAGLLRLDVDKRPENIEPTEHPAIPRDAENRAAFSIPADNPLVPRWQGEGSDPESELRLEFYAIGLRNPWRFTFDPTTGDLWLADVGQNQWEEVNIIQKGGNYGWPIREAAHPGPRSRAIPEPFSELTDPIFEYSHNLGNSITGGIVYRGSALPELYGAYVFSDFGSGRVWAISEDGNGDYIAREITSISSVVTFGVDPRDGELLASNIFGDVSKLIRDPNTEPPAFPATLSETGAFADLEDLSPHAGLYAYDVNLPFWSDFADKRRWVSVPAPDQIAYELNAPWTFPQGTVWVKHFELETERGNPESTRRVETRFIVKTDDSAYGVSYRWNEAQTEAFLASADGESIEIPITVDGQQITQTWSIPSRRQCLGCHTRAAGYALSFNTRQLNRNFETKPNEIENLLSYFSYLGILDTHIQPSDDTPRYHQPSDASISLETRARSYLAVNCVSCHQPGGGAPPTWDARPHLTLESAGLLDGEAANDGGDPDKRLILPNEPGRSVIIDRMAARGGFSRMPPFGSNALDPEGIELLTRWVASLGIEDAFALWQIEHFGSSALPEAAPTADPDRDGTSNRLEFLVGSLPLDPNSVWQPTFHGNSESITVAFPYISGRAFILQKSDDLSSWTDWNAIERPFDAEGNTAEVEIPLSEEAFYRIAVE